MESGKPENAEVATGDRTAQRGSGRAGCGQRPQVPLLRERGYGGNRGAAASGTESVARNSRTTDRRETTMMRAKRKNTAFTLPVRPLCRKKPSIAGQKRKHLQQKSSATSKGRPDTAYSFKFAIETVSFSAYYPHNNSKKSR